MVMLASSATAPQAERARAGPTWARLPLERAARHASAEDATSSFSGGAGVKGTYLDEVLMMRNAAGTKYYYHVNHLYSVHAITNASGNIVEAVKSYDAYGKPAIITGAGTDATWFTGDDVVGSVSGIGNPWFYTGQRLDAETGLMYYKNRYYSAELGRFVGRDPARSSLHQTLYSYDGIDKLGLGEAGNPNPTNPPTPIPEVPPPTKPDLTNLPEAEQKKVWQKYLDESKKWRDDVIEGKIRAGKSAPKDWPACDCWYLELVENSSTKICFRTCIKAACRGCGNPYDYGSCEVMVQRAEFVVGEDGKEGLTIQRPDKAGLFVSAGTAAGVRASVAGEHYVPVKKSFGGSGIGGLTGSSESKEPVPNLSVPQTTKANGDACGRVRCFPVLKAGVKYQFWLEVHCPGIGDSAQTGKAFKCGETTVTSK